jgi:hypothetical protein
MQKQDSQKQDSRYIGNKGYTINKKELDKSQIDFIKSSLNIVPFVNPKVGGVASSYPVYRESTQKIYMPRYFGNEHFGPPSENKLYKGDNISVPFVGSLRDSQIPVVQTYMDAVRLEGGGGLFDIPCAGGKTVISLNIISQVKKKTLIIVHKEFLMNQWIERIEEFLPSAKVGKIQGKVFDIENKDIVLGMLQSLSMKEYSENAFNTFGFTIVDEVHHISSEVFSKALFKIVTYYTLGLSATMERLDGTTKVIKMFLGPIIYVGKREEHSVVVRAIHYTVNDEDFNRVEMDYRGNVKYSTMISKLCEYNRRSEFIVQVIKDMVKENTKQQIMVLAHNRNILKYIHDAIASRVIATVGYYVGGMKEEELKKTELKTIVIATYSMAAEALDIKTLSAVIFATPKTNIEQSVGRILRVKHGFPIVVDIVDSHSVFKNQWYKRKKYYNSNKYTIIQTNNTEYHKNEGKCFHNKNNRNSNIKHYCHDNDDADDDNDYDDDDICNNNNYKGPPLNKGDKELLNTCLIKLK